jgi:hypothetical protein
MERTRIKRSLWLWLLLPLLFLRGLVPAGYMIAVTENGLEIVLCDSGIYRDSAVAQQLASTQQGSEHPGEHHHHGKGNVQHDHSICPFAVAATGAPAPELPELNTGSEVGVGSFMEDCRIIAGLSGPSRAQQSRAPPALA